MRVRHRRLLVLAALALTIASVAGVAAMYRAEPSVTLQTGGSPDTLTLLPGTSPILEEPTTAEPPPPTTGPATVPRTTPTTGVPPEDGAPRGCVPGTFVERYHSCTWKPVTISGRVTDAAGRPLPDMCVRSSVVFEGLLARTDGQGRYRMEAPQGGLLLYAESCDDGGEFGWVPGGTQAPPIEAGEAGVAPDIALVERGGVYGQAVDGRGDPVAGVCVHGRVTDAQGRFSVRGLDPGPRQVGFTPAGDTSCPSRWALAQDNAHVTVISGRWIGPVTLVALTVVDQ